MSHYRFKFIRKWCHFCFTEIESCESDPWYLIEGGVKQYNRIRRNLFPNIQILVLDESMCGWVPRTTKHGGLPHLTFQKRKPVSLGTEMKTACCGTTGILVNLEVQRGKAEMKLQKYNTKYGHCTGQVLRSIESVQNFEVIYDQPVDRMSCLRGPVRTQEFYEQCEVSDKQVVVGDSFFSSVQSATESMKLFGRHYIGVVKQAYSKFPKDFLKETMKNAPAGAQLLLTTKHEGVYLCALGYKYSRSGKVTCFIFTRGAGTTNTYGSHYFQRKTDTFGNVYDRCVERPQVAHTFFEHAGVIDEHNKIRQGMLYLEKKWLTKNPWFRLCTTLIGMHLVDAFQLYKFKLDSRIQPMSVLEFSEVVAAQLVNDDFSDMNPMEHDPDMARFEENENNENKKISDSQENITDYYCSFVVEHSTGHRSKHRLIKSELRENK